SAGTAQSALSKNAPPIQLANPKPLEAWEGENANPEPLRNTDGWDAAALPLVEKAFADDRLFHATNYTSERGQKRPGRGAGERRGGWRCAAPGRAAPGRLRLPAIGDVQGARPRHAAQVPFARLLRQ